MKITLIEPAMIKQKGFSEKPMFTFQPLTLGVLAGLTPADIEVQSIDDRLETINYDQPRDLVGISVQTFSARRAYQIAAEFRKRGVPVVLGGYHPTLLPEEALHYADAVVQGAAEGVWSRLLEDARQGQLRRLYQSTQALPLRNVSAQRSIYKGKHYLPASLLETSRGCPQECSFCAVSVFSGRENRSRPVAEVVAEIAGLGKDFIFFVDDNIVGNPCAARELFQALIPLKIRWVGQASLAMTRNLELMQLMQKSGCQGVLVGIETLNPENLRLIGKRWNTAGIGYGEELKIVREHGIAVVGSFVIGLDADTLESLDATVEFAIEQSFFAAMFNILMPYPGTRLYADLLQQGRLTHPNWWIDPEYTYGSVVFKPKNIPAAALAEKRLEMYRCFYGAGSIFKRMANFHSNIANLWKFATYLGLNLPACRQETRRYGLALGDEINT